MSFVRPMHGRKSILTIFNKSQEYNRVALQVLWGISVCVALLGLIGCSDGPDSKPLVWDIQSEFETHGFEFTEYDARDAGALLGWVKGISPDGRTTVVIEGLSPVRGKNWSSAILVIDDFESMYFTTDLEREVEFTWVLASILTPSKETDFKRQIVKAWESVFPPGRIGTVSQIFDNVTVETVLGSDEKMSLPNLTLQDEIDPKGKMIVTFRSHPLWE